MRVPVVLGAAGGCRRRGWWLPAVLASLSALSLGAQTTPRYTLENGVINSGAAESHGGRYSVAGSAGQPVTGTGGGGPFSVEGGRESDTQRFQLPIVPSLVVLNSPPTRITVGWLPEVPGYVLEYTDTLRSPEWHPYRYVTNNQAVITGPKSRLFFRLRKVEPGPTQ